MLVQINTDKNIEGNNRFNEFFTEEITTQFERFDSMVTRFEVHISDENGSKPGKKDKKCVIEARVEKKQPIVVSAFADTTEKSFFEAMEKMERSLDATLEKIKEY